MRKSSKTSKEMAKAQLFQCSQKGLRSAMLQQQGHNITYSQMATQLYYKNNISSVSYKNNAIIHCLMSCQVTDPCHAGARGVWGADSP